MLDIIIPAYKAHDTIGEALKSILNQETVMLFNVTIVNDYPEGKDYSEFINKFAEFFPIQEIKMNENMGPASARQKGLECTLEEWVMFVDSDDLLIEKNSLELVYQNILKNKDAIKICFLSKEEDRDGSYKELPRERVLNAHNARLHGNIYKRSFLEKNNIKFIEKAFWNEDVAFNLDVKICAMNKNLLKHIFVVENYIYIWKYNINAITKINNEEFSFFKAPVGQLENEFFICQKRLRIGNLNKEAKEFIEGELFALILRNYYNLHVLIAYNPKNKYEINTLFNKVLEVYDFYKKNIEKNFDYIYTYHALEFSKDYYLRVIPFFTFFDFLFYLEHPEEWAKNPPLKKYRKQPLKEMPL